VGFSTATGGSGAVNRSKTAFAKTMLLFFAVLFVAVLVHPDVDLLDVHDVKISSARLQIHSVEGRLVPQLPGLFARPQLGQPYLLIGLRCVDDAGSSGDQNSSSILRI
jgi:hypothetical protein